MKPALIITTYNRPYYLSQCFDTVRAAFIPEVTLIIIVDDASTDQETINLIKSFTINEIAIIKIFKKENKTVCSSLLMGIERAFEEGCDVIINLDGDAIVSAWFMDNLLRVKSLYENHIITGFNSTTKNRDGSERHRLASYPYIDQESVVFKESVGGINMCFNKEDFEKHIRLALVKGALKQGNWDHLASISAAKSNEHIAALKKSVVQHIGFDSSMGHNEPPDTSDEFHELYLPNVTLICVDCVDVNRALKALDISRRNIKFGAIKFITSLSVEKSITDLEVYSIDALNTIQEYSEFIIKHLWRYVQTEFILLIQHDGYVLRPSAWKEEFLNYDYVGAKWNQYPASNVGNGGFSLRSKKLMEILAQDPVVQETHPEDHVIGRTYRKYLEGHRDIKFAPSQLADEFSIEAHANPNPVYSGQFGFHGGGIDFSKYHLGHVPYETFTDINSMSKRELRQLLQRRQK